MTPPIDGAVAADELGGRVHDDVGAVLQRAAQPRGGHGVVHDQRHADVVGHARPRRRCRRCRSSGCRWSRRRRPWCCRGPRRARRRDRRVVDEADLDAQLGQRVVEEVVRPAVERRARHDVIAGLRQGEHGHGLGGLTRGDGERAGDPDGGLGATFEVGHARLEDPLGGVHDPRVDVAHLFEGEQRGAVRGVAELVGGGLVDGHRPRPGGRVRLLAGMDHACLEALVSHARSVGATPHSPPDELVNSGDSHARLSSRVRQECGWRTTVGTRQTTGGPR